MTLQFCTPLIIGYSNDHSIIQSDYLDYINNTDDSMDVARLDLTSCYVEKQRSQIFLHDTYIFCIGSTIN